MGMVRKSANVVLVLFACAPVALAGLNDYGVMWSNQASYEPESGQGTHNRFSSQMGVLGTSGYVTTGWLSSNGTEPVWGVNIGLGSWHGAVTQFDKWGGTRWTDMTNVTDIVGASLDQTYLRGVAVRGDEVVIAGQSRWNMETGASGTGLFVRKYGGNGSITAPDNFDPDLDYAKSFNEGSAWGRSSHIATDGTVYTGGYATANVAGLTYNGSGSADRDAFLIKHNADGTVASGIYPNLSSEHDYAAAITTDASGNIYVMGGTYGSLSGFTNPNPNVSGSGGTADFFVVKYDSSWTQQWAKQWDGGGSGQDWLYSAGIDPNTGNLVAVGFTATSTNGNDAYIVAIDPSDGSTEWSDTFGTTGEEGASGISWDEDGNIWTGGDTSGNLAATVKGDADVFWRQYSNTGSVLNTIQLGTDAPEDGRGAAVDGDPQRLYISGGIQGVDESIRNANPDKAYAWRGWDPVLGTHPNNSEQFVIKVTAGDLNGDGYVDWDDLTHVGNSIGSTNADNGDFDGNGTVEQADMDDFVTRLFETFYGDAALSGDWDVNDIDYVTKKAFASTYSAIADMDFDRDTDETDVDLWLAAAAAANGFGSAYYRGDANLDGTVDGQDFSLLKANFGSSDAAWIDGDFNGDGNVDGQDFSLLKANFGAASAEQIAALETFEASIVPEPASLLLLGLGGILLTRRRTMS